MAQMLPRGERVLRVRVEPLAVLPTQQPLPKMVRLVQVLIREVVVQQVICQSVELVVNLVRVQVLVLQGAQVVQVNSSSPTVRLLQPLSEYQGSLFISVPLLKV
jgi:hypothetical protein